MEIEQALKERIADSPEARESVVLCCKAGHHVSEDELRQHGFKVSEIQQIDDECWVYGEIALRDIPKLADVSAIELVASGPDARIM